MIKQLILLFHVFGIFFYQLIFSGDITVNQQLPSSMEAGKDVVVEITIHKNDITGFAMFKQDIPQGFSAEAIDTKGATFSFKENKIKIIWMSLPAEEEFTISYKLSADASLSGDFTFGGKFSFIAESERKNIELIPSTISVVEELIAETQNEKEPINTDPTTPIAVLPVTTVDNNEKITIAINRTISEINPGTFNVNVIINKKGVEGFAKINEKIPVGFIAIEDNSNHGVFSFKDQDMKILWMAVPRGDEFEISYTLKAKENTTNGKYQIDGEFSYLEDDATNKYAIDVSNFNLNKPESIVESIVEPIEEVIEDPVENKVTSIPNPETGISYKIQICAGHKTVASNYFAKKFNINEEVSTMNHQGWIKYLVGSFTEYKQARDKRESIQVNIKTAFVTAYNTGKRITVQEALMISNQKWYK